MRRGRRSARRLSAALLLTAALAPAPPAAAADSVKPGTVPVGVETNAGGARITFRWWRETPAEIDHDGREWRIRFKRRAFIETADLKAALHGYNPRVVGGHDGIAIAFELPDGMRLSQSRDGLTVVAEIAKDAAPAEAPAPKPAAEAKPPPEPPKPPPEPAKAPAEQTKRAGRVRYIATSDGGQFRFEGAAGAAAAVFRRGGGLWIAVEGTLPLDVAQLRMAAAATVPFVEQVPAEGATVLRLATLAGWNPSLRRADGAWIVELKRQPFRPDAPVAAGPRSGGLPPSLLFPLKRPAPPIRVVDPEVGDELRVVLTPEPGQGLPAPLDYVDLRALASAQGLAFRLLSDGVVLRSVGEGVEVTRPGGLAISTEDDRRQRTSAQGTLFDFPAWSVPEADFLHRRQALQQTIAAAPPEGRTAARLALAKFYLAAGYGAEAVGVLDAVQRDDPAAAGELSFRAWKGAAALLAGDRDGAAELRQAVFDQEPEVALWRGELAAESGDWATAAREFPRGLRYIASLPAPLRQRFAVHAAEAALNTGDTAKAADIVGRVLADSPAPPEHAAARLIEARLKQRTGDRAGALAILDEVAAGHDRPSRARAELARTELRLAGGELERAAAIRTLDRLRFAWRGDDFEFTVLRRLADLKLADGDFRGGVDALHEAQALFPNRPENRDIAQRLSDAFADVFLGPRADGVSPLKALALFDEHRDLLPSGEKGDEIIRRLADRLVGVELLDRAASLLEDQVKNRLAGREKARVATRLALVRLLDHKPDAALAALKIDVGADLPPELVQQRRHLEARALVELDRGGQALALLDGDTSPDADRLRADIAWRTQNWREAAAAFGRLAKPPGADGRLAEEDCRTVMNWAAALTMTGDRTGVAALREKYRTAMEQSPFRDAFRVIAGEAAGGDVRDLARQVAQIGDLQSFMAGYRQKIAGQNLSAIN